MDFLDEKDKLESFYAFIEDYKGKDITEKHVQAIKLRKYCRKS